MILIRYYLLERKSLCENHNDEPEIKQKYLSNFCLANDQAFRKQHNLELFHIDLICEF